MHDKNLSSYSVPSTIIRHTAEILALFIKRCNVSERLNIDSMS